MTSADPMIFVPSSAPQAPNNDSRVAPAPPITQLNQEYHMRMHRRFSRVLPIVGGALAFLMQVVPVRAQAPKPDSPSADPKVWVNYDFVPGNRVIFFTDYSDDQVGNFPKKLTFKTGNMEVAEVDGRRFLRATTHSVFIIPLPEVLPAKFTIEIDVINRKSLDGAAFQMQGTLVYMRDGSTSTIAWGSGGTGLSGGHGGETPYSYDDAVRTRYRGKPAQLRVLGDGDYIKAYIDEKRFVNVPNAKFGHTNGLLIDLDARGDENPVYVGRIRVAESGKSIYDELAAKGRVSTQGILFDSGSDRIKPESAPTLKDIGTMLASHPELKLSVEGHTDNVGIPADNLKLSESRAAAVKAALVKDYGIEVARLQSKGLGSTKPLAVNTTAEARQNNRRVELVKI
ncbi:MAG: OmpA family protein [Gemmatimonadota bacterium]